MEGLFNIDTRIANDLDEIANGINNVTDPEDSDPDTGYDPSNVNFDDDPFDDGKPSNDRDPPNHGEPPSNTGGNGGDRGFKSSQRLTNHFNEHNVEFDPPFANEQEYEKAAIDFMRGNGEKVPDDVYQASFYRPGSTFHGDLVRYDEARNLFGMKTSEGFLRTFYRPVNGILEFFETFMPRS